MLLVTGETKGRARCLIKGCGFSTPYNKHDTAVPNVVGHFRETDYDHFSAWKVCGGKVDSMKATKARKGIEMGKLGIWEEKYNASKGVTGSDPSAGPSSGVQALNDPLSQPQSVGSSPGVSTVRRWDLKLALFFCVAGLSFTLLRTDHDIGILFRDFCLEISRGWYVPVGAVVMGSLILELYAHMKALLMIAIADARKAVDNRPFIHMQCDVWTHPHVTKSYANLHISFMDASNEKRSICLAVKEFPGGHTNELSYS